MIGHLFIYDRSWLADHGKCGQNQISVWFQLQVSWTSWIAHATGCRERGNVSKLRNPETGNVSKLKSLAVLGFLNLETLTLLGFLNLETLPLSQRPVAWAVQLFQLVETKIKLKFCFDHIFHGQQGKIFHIGKNVQQGLWLE